MGFRRADWTLACPDRPAEPGDVPIDEYVIAALHSVDYVAVGLSSSAGPAITWPARRWSRSTSLETEKQLAMDQLIEWLPRHLPPEGEARIVHGDYRIDNLIFHPTEPGDWRPRLGLSTTRDPGSPISPTTRWPGG
jgi:hypothetical protein